MRFEEWEPVYERILTEFGFSRSSDEAARDVLDSLVSSSYDPAQSDLTGQSVAVAGAGPSLGDEIDHAAEADVVFAASTAADALLENGVDVDFMVTDLDKNPETAVDLSRHGTPVAAHAHGDNIPAVREWFPQFDQSLVLPTTQAAPSPHVRNFGGFTDGDRAAFLADHLGAASLVFVGWDFDDPAVDAMKRKKLQWAARLLWWLEQRRGERFSLLDGVRETLGSDWVPPRRP